MDVPCYTQLINTSSDRNLSNTLQLLLTFDPILVEKVATLLNLVTQDNPTVSRLYLTGVFYFIMMYTGSNVLPVAHFLKHTHAKQAFRSDEVSQSMHSLLMEYIVHGSKNQNDSNFKLIFGASLLKR